MKYLIYMLLVVEMLSVQPLQAQFISAQLDLAGLTCSLCSNSVERSVRQLDFVQDMKVDLNDNTSEVIFKPGKKVDINALAQKVYDAGFSVINLSAVFNFNHQPLKAGDVFTYADDQYIFIDPDKDALHGNVRLNFVGQKFLSRRDYKNWEKQLPKVAETGNFANTYFVKL